MRKTIWAVVVTVVLIGMGATAPAQAQTGGERFGIGKFTYQNKTFVGLAMRYPTEPQEIGGVVVELPAAAQAADQTGIPDDVMAIIEQWATVGSKIKQIVAYVGPMIDSNRPAYVHDYTAVDALAPFVPRLAMYGFGNYREVLNQPDEPAPPAPSIPGIWERAPNDDRPVNPRIFMIPNTPEVFIGDGEPVINWHADKRNQYEYECELLGVVAKPMRRVPVDQVKSYMFGYSNTNDISDRQGRTPDEWTGDRML
ncbi:MAG: fumarylacetoacetate hydrolase family protein, partial [Vicinamibacteria bacterium]